VDATCHWGLDKGTEVFVFDCSFVLIHSSFSVAIDGGNVLQVAFSSLVANRTIERMVCEQKFHHAAIIIY
jgi:hypothetical protein